MSRPGWPSHCPFGLLGIIYYFDQQFIAMMVRDALTVITISHLAVKTGPPVHVCPTSVKTGGSQSYGVSDNVITRSLTFAFFSGVNYI